MFELKNTIKVGDWDIVNNDLFAIQDTHINQLSLLGDYIKTIYSLKEFWGVKFYCDFIHIFTMYSNNTLIDYKGQIIYEKPNFSFYHFFDVKKYIGYDRKIKKVVLIKDDVLIELHNGRIGINKVISNNFIFTNKEKKDIYFIDLDHPEQPIWHFDLNQFGTYRKITDDLAYKVVQFVGIWQGKLLVQLTNARLIALDINTGELLHDIEINKTNPLTKAYYDAYIKMHLVDDKIIWLTNQTLLHIDLNTFTPVVVKEYYNLPKERQWRFMHNTYHKGKLYFTADYAWQYVTPSYVGVMDAQTGTVLWSQQLEKTGGLPEAPKVTDEKLYIRTNNKVLHIFEKTENESL